MASPQQDGANDPVGRRPFSFQVPPDPAQTPTPGATTQQSQTPQAQREWSGFPEQRFSYIETPIDENTQTFDDERQAAALEEARRRYGELNPPSQPATPQPPVQQTTTPQTSPPPPVTAFPPEKQGVSRVPSAYQQPPPAQQHPAFSAPVAHQQYPQPHPPTSALAQSPLQHTSTPSPQQVPLSPGPLPLKDERDFPQARHPQRTAVQPDAQPPMFQPPPNSHFSVYSAHGGVHATSGTPAPANVFRHGLCTCPGSDMGTCCTGIFCPCILYSRLQYRISRRSKRSDPTDLLGWEKCDSACIGFGMLSLCGLCGILAGIARGRVRRAYGIEGGTASDCIEGCCCCCCAVIQGEREVRAREEDRNGTAGRRQVDPYQKHPSMAYQQNGA